MTGTKETPVATNSSGSFLPCFWFVACTTMAAARAGSFSTGANSHFRELCTFLESDASPLVRFTPAGADPDSVIDVRAVFQQGHRDLAVDAMPSVLLPKKGKFGLADYNH